MPETLRLLIENWAQQNGCDCYEMATGYLSKDEILKGSWNFKNAVVFIYGFSATGVIVDTDKLTQPLLTVETPEHTIQYHKIATVTDNGTIQQASSNFCYRVENSLKLELSEGAYAMFAKIYSCNLQYVVLQQKCNCNN